MSKMKNIEKEKMLLSKEIKEKEQLKATLQRRVPILIKNNDSGLDDLYEQISKLTNEIYLLRNKYIKL
jgi:hypothetical protein